MTVSILQTAERNKKCVHSSVRVDGHLDHHCLLCGTYGYWHNGHRHDFNHPSGKILFGLECKS